MLPEAQLATGPVLFAHRGGLAHGRENTVKTCRTALQLGATGLETDLRLTADGVLVCLHGPVVWTSALRRRSVERTAYGDLPHWVPTLGQVLDVAGAAGVPVSIDVKHPDVEPALLAVTASLQDPGQAWLCGTLDQLHRWRASQPALCLVLSVDRRDLQWRAVDPGVVDAVNLPYRQWDAALLSAASEVGVGALGWGFGSRTATAVAALRLGLDGIYGDDVRALVRARDSQ